MTMAEKEAAAVGGLVDPKRLKQWYDMPLNWQASAKGNKQGVVGFLGEHMASRGDMVEFLRGCLL